MGLMVAGIAGNAAGAMAKKGMDKLLNGPEGPSVGEQIHDEINRMNKQLSANLDKSLHYSENYTGKAIGVQNQYNDIGVNELRGSLYNATNAAQGSLFQGFNSSQALQSPYALMGYNAADAYADSLGLARPKDGSASMAQNMNLAASAISPQKIQELQDAAKKAGIDNPYATQTAPVYSGYQMPNQASYRAALPDEMSAALNWADANPDQFNKGGSDYRILRQRALDANKVMEGWKQSNQGVYDQAQQNFQATKAQPFNQFQQAQQSLLSSLGNINPEQLKQALAYRSGNFNTPTVI